MRVICILYVHISVWLHSGIAKLSLRLFSKYQLALFQIDSMRKDGRFIGVDGSIPEGQGIINANLSECHELVEMVGDILQLFIARA